LLWRNFVIEKERLEGTLLARVEKTLLARTANLRFVVLCQS